MHVQPSNNNNNNTRNNNIIIIDTMLQLCVVVKGDRYMAITALSLPRGGPKSTFISTEAQRQKRVSVEENSRYSLLQSSQCK